MKKKRKIVDKFFGYHVEVNITGSKDCKSWNYALYTDEPILALFKIATVIERNPKIRSN